MTESGSRPVSGVVRLAVGMGLLLMPLLLSLPGCSGCGNDPIKTREELKKKLAEERAKKKKPPDPFECSYLRTRPDSAWSALSEQSLGPPAKPGHWTATTMAAKANNDNFFGTLQIAAVDRNANSIPLAATRFDLTTSRQVSLKKGRPKLLESVLFVPPSGEQMLVSYGLNTRGGVRSWQGSRRITQMPSYQYHLVVLARSPERYTYLKALDTVDPPSDTLNSNPIEPYYRVSLTGGERQSSSAAPLLLPSQGLLWTSIACVLWDDAAPDDLSLDQQDAEEMRLRSERDDARYYAAKYAVGEAGALLVLMEHAYEGRSVVSEPPAWLGDVQERINPDV